MSNKISDVAKCAGVSPATVSRVFNKHPYVKKEIRWRVLEAARSLNYAPKSTKSKNSYGIMVSGDLFLNLGAYETQLITAISGEIFKRGHSTEITTDQQISFMHGNSYHALIILTKPGCERIDEIGVPVVLVNHLMNGVPSVATDHFQGIELAVEHLIKNGHTRIGYISGRGTNWGTTERMRGYVETLNKHGLDLYHALTEETEGEGVVEATVKLMRRKPTAIIVSGEGRAQRLSHALYLLEKKIPDDISIISFEDKNVTPFLSPPHTTISQNIANLAESIANLAMEITSGGKVSNPNIVLKNELIVRESVKHL